jgi:hypothetical protein
MPRSNSRSQKGRSDRGVLEMARERPIAAAAAAASAAVAGLFLWSKRNQISNQLNNLSDQIGGWTESMMSSSGTSSETGDRTDLKTGRANLRTGAGSPSGTRTDARGRTSTSRRARGPRRTSAAGAAQATESGGPASDNI